MFGPGGSYERQGFVKVPGFADRTVCDAMLERVVDIARGAAFADFAASSEVLALVHEVVSPQVDCFLAQFIFKNPGAWGQPWHQDSYYFPFEPAHPVCGIWLAVTESTLGNGCLHVLPGSHREPVHEHVPDARPGANYGYVEIVDHDMGEAVPVLMDPGDLLVFDSHLMHRSTDNGSDGIRAAMVFHYARHGTRELREGLVTDFVPVGVPA